MLIKDLTVIGTSKYVLLDKTLRDMAGIVGKVRIDFLDGKIIIQAVKENKKKEVK
jgi:hypothetical protein